MVLLSYKERCMYIVIAYRCVYLYNNLLLTHTYLFHIIKDYLCIFGVCIDKAMGVLR